MINPVTGVPFTAADVDRILGLADQFIEDWESNPDQDDGDRTDSAERRIEYDALRPLLLRLPDLLELRAQVNIFLHAEVADGQSYSQIIAPLIAAADNVRYLK